MIFSGDKRISEQQIELLKSFKYLRSQEDINNIKELLSIYYEHKLDAAIEKTETERNYSVEVYELWLKQKSSL